MGNESIKNIFKGNVGKLLFIKYYKLKKSLESKDYDVSLFVGEKKQVQARPR